MQGFLDTDTGEVGLYFDAEFKFNAGSLYQESAAAQSKECHAAYWQQDGEEVLSYCYSAGTPPLCSHSSDI